jgi:hypothetical protein
VRATRATRSTRASGNARKAARIVAKPLFSSSFVVEEQRNDLDHSDYVTARKPHLNGF